MGDQGQDERCIVACCDGQIGDDYSVTESELKCDFSVGGGVVALWAGTVDHVEDALRIYKRRLAAKPLRLDDYKEELKVGFDEFRDSLARRGERPNIELIIAGFIEGDPKIIHVAGRNARAKPYFLAIGSGSYLADAILRWRNPNQYSDLHKVLYYVYEAKMLGEASPHVGKHATYIFVLSASPDGSLKAGYVLTKGMHQLSDDFKEFGPRSFFPKTRFPFKEMAPIKVG